MSIKSFVKKHAPKSFIPFLRLSYRTYKESRCRKKHPITEEQKQAAAKQIQAVMTKAVQYLPYYQDALSGEILSDRLDYIKTGDRNIFLDRAEKTGMKFYNMPCSEDSKYTGIVLLYDHEDNDFRYTQRLLSSGRWSDRYRFMTLNEFIEGAAVSDTELIAPFLTEKGQFKLTARLIARNIKADVVSDSVLTLTREDLQYFDVFTPVDDEVVVDAGCYDGATAIRFLEWGKGKIKHVYSFEFDPENAAKCEENLKPYADRVILVKKGTWDKDEVIHADASGGSGSSVNRKGSTEVYLTTIDSVVQDERVTFIKMDVEGAELKSLMGARNTIIKNHPRLAICAYHKPSDLYELPEYILSLVPEYKFLLRHYSSREYETVLYAYCD